jgi:ribosomal protein S18 acetylase RimI-like enzyme
MEIRKIKLPQDIDDLAKVSLASFQYPDNPEWSIDEDEAQGLSDQINGIKRFWPLLRLSMLFSATMRYLFMGYVCVEDGRMIGTLMYQRRPNGDYYISNVAVHPDQRRRGIARKLVETALAELRAAGGKKVLLDVISGNLPAYGLYERLGWKHFSGSVHLLLDGALNGTAPAPGGYEVSQLALSDWKTMFELAGRITPPGVRVYLPVEEASFRESALLRILEPLTGVHNGKAAVRDQGDGKLAGVCGYSYRSRPGGNNTLHINLDPDLSLAAPYFLDTLTRKVQSVAPGRRVELIVPAWQPHLVECAKELGFTLRYEYHSLGLML